MTRPNQELVRDVQTVTPAGEPTAALPAGVIRRDAITHIDERGSVVELFDPRWGWHADPLVFAYSFTIRPGFVKGWGLHKQHEDRYFILSGEMELVMYDERPDSPTYGLVSRVVMSELRRGLINIPAGVWHADHNIGQKDVVVVNFPTIQYDHTSPDKYRLPLENDRIPFRFHDVRGF
ncbi:MAG TPA: dTDP-4-dehydrorhamnose 3,5-epimerase family protein [Thermoanaerobaculia bacterium]|nr:dTDP-4-dehydrorhamnose 3,5-epimerase family protein [Thermoanaerobaculia bacterium]